MTEPIFAGQYIAENFDLRTRPLVSMAGPLGLLDANIYAEGEEAIDAAFRQVLARFSRDQEERFLGLR